MESERYGWVYHMLLYKPAYDPGAGIEFDLQVSRGRLCYLKITLGRHQLCDIYIQVLWLGDMA